MTTFKQCQSVTKRKENDMRPLFEQFTQQTKLFRLTDTIKCS